MKAPITHILLADDHPILRKGLREIIEEGENFSVVAETSNGESALALIEQYLPDIAVLDVDMPKMSGLEVAVAVQEKKLKTKIIILTMYDNENIFNRALDSGVLGYLLKDNAISEILEALQKVNEGKYYITPSLSEFLVKRAPNRQTREGQNILGQLSPTERKVLKLVSDNLTNKEIAEKLFISIRTVETHRNNICQKLNLQGPNALLKFAVENKFLLQS